MVDGLLAKITAERVDRDWCLFLDRDGVINTRLMGAYVRTWDEFEFAPGAVNALRTLSNWAPRIVVVTNQQGVGKGLMTESDLADIHNRMRHEISEGGGRVDAVQFCPHLAADGCDCRKPDIGMAQAYLRGHPEVAPPLSVMIGDTASDVEMGRRLAAAAGGCFTVRISERPDALADATFVDLAQFASEIAALLDGPASVSDHSAE